MTPGERATGFLFFAAGLIYGRFFALDDAGWAVATMALLITGAGIFLHLIRRRR